ncbi:MAG: CoA transferase [Ilumatobacteraceae bacterium]
MAALDGMRVLDFTQYEAGPSCCQYLAWLGADVVKVEPPHGEPGRRTGAPGGKAQYFENYNANKRSVAVDVATAAGRGLVRRLVVGFDVFVENQGPHVMEKLGLDPLSLQAVHPSLIYARIKGYGLSGPYAEYRSFDMLAQAAGGLFSLTGTADGPPVRPGGTFGDTATGAHTAMAILAAYVQQQRTGEGQVIEMSMHEVMTMFIRTTGVSGWDLDAPAAERIGNRLGGAPTDMYPCAPFGPNDYVYVMIGTARMWDALCKVLERTDLLHDPRFANAGGRAEHEPELNAIVAAWCAMRSKHEAMMLLADAGIAASAVMDTRDVFHDPHLVARGFVQEVPHPTHGSVLLLDKPFRLEKSNVPLRAAPVLGADTDTVLAAELGLVADELDALRAEGVIA